MVYGGPSPKRVVTDYTLATYRGSITGTFSSDVFKLNYLRAKVRAYALPGSDGTALKKAYYEGTVKGSVALDFSTRGLYADGFLLFDTRTKKYEIEANIRYESTEKGLYLNVTGSRNVGFCDNRGFELRGSMVLGPWGGLYGEGTASGQKHCEPDATALYG
jgi:hypothetical protein